MGDAHSDCKDVPGGRIDASARCGAVCLDVDASLSFGMHGGTTFRLSATGLPDRLPGRWKTSRFRQHRSRQASSLPACGRRPLVNQLLDRFGGLGVGLLAAPDLDANIVQNLLGVTLVRNSEVGRPCPFALELR